MNDAVAMPSTVARRGSTRPMPQLAYRGLMAATDRIVRTIPCDPQPLAANYDRNTTATARNNSVTPNSYRLPNPDR
jgi:hypothetical protein